MPWYEYRCTANGRTLEAMHGMSDEVTTWGALCERAGEDPGDTDLSSPVEKVFNASLSIAKGTPTGIDPARGGDAGGSCGAGCGCHPS